MHILLFYQYYHNYDCAHGGRHYTFARHLSRQHRLTIIGSDAFSNARLTAEHDWAPEGVDVIHVPAPYDNRYGERGRLLSYGRYAVGALAAARKLDRPDVIVGSSTPLTAAWAARRAAQRFGVPWVFEVRDLWPDFPVQMGAVRSRFVQRSLYRLESTLYRSAAHIVPLSVDMRAHIEQTGIPSEKITVIPNGTDIDLAERHPPGAVDQLRAELGLGDRQVVLYAGTFGRANDTGTLVEVAKYLSTRKDVCFIFCGSGFDEPVLAEAASRLPNVILLRPKPRHEIFLLFRLASISLVTFLDLPVLASNSPAKFFDSLATGTPVVVTNPGWTKRFVEEHRCGWYVPLDRPADFADRLASLLADLRSLSEAGSAAAEAARRHFDRRELARQFENVLLEAVR